MRVLRIFDVLPFVHAGAVNKRAYLVPELKDAGDSFVEEIIYCGGASLLWNILYQEYGKCDMVFCSDRTPTVKQGMFPGYKMSREHKEMIRQSRDVCEYILKDCGFTVLADDGYEADDFIYSLVRDLKKQYDMIYIYTGDSDLYFLVDDNVTILPSSSRAKEVTKQNYTYTAGGSKMEYVPYNMSTFYKILFGDTSDGIPGVGGELASRMRNIYDRKEYHKFMGDKETVIELMSLAGDKMRAQAELVFPLDVQVPNEFGMGDKLKIAEWGSAFRNRYWATGNGPSERITQLIEEMAELGMATER